MKMEQINVTKTFLPPLEEFQAYVAQIWQSGQLTNQGPLLKRLETEIDAYLKIKNVQFVTNGTIALQIALRSLDILSGEVITTPFSYVATTSSILWERCEPVFVDIEPDSLCMDPQKIEAAITPRTRAIMPVHVFGNPCDIEKIAAIAAKHKLSVIYDAAHAFGVTYKGKSLLDYGDVSMCSLHATKLFHTIEGGLLVARDKQVGANIEHLKKFGHMGDEHIMLGINGKASEFQAAMGLCNLPYVDRLMQERKHISEEYDRLLGGRFGRPTVRKDTGYNYAYYPVLFKDEQELLSVFDKLKAKHIFPRRYFYPSLNTLPYLEKKIECPISEDIAKRIACLPLFSGMTDVMIKKIAGVLTA